MFRELEWRRKWKLLYPKLPSSQTLGALSSIRFGFREYSLGFRTSPMVATDLFRLF